MIRHAGTVVTLIILSSLAGCRSFPLRKAEILNALVIRNQTRSTIHDVTLNVPKTGTLIACSAILPGTACSLGFPELKNKRLPATLSWTQEGNTYTSDVSAEGTKDAQSDRPLEVVVNVVGRGQLDVYFQVSSSP